MSRTRRDFSAKLKLDLVLELLKRPFLIDR